MVTLRLAPSGNQLAPAARPLRAAQSAQILRWHPNVFLKHSMKRLGGRLSLAQFGHQFDRRHVR
jgi:hypothetical protein